MSKRIWTLALVCALALLVGMALPAAAQESGWSAYLLNNVTSQLVRVDLDGRQTSYDLGLPAGSFVGGSMIDFTDDGNRAAYCLSVNTDTGSTASLIVRDLAAASNALTVDLGKTDGCWVTYSADNRQIAVGLVRYYAGDPNADASAPPWQLLVFDAASGAQVAEMNAALAAAGGFDPARGSVMPQVRYFANGQIVFAPVQWGTEGYPSSPAYLWQVGDASVQAIDRWWRWGLDSLDATGELVWLELNDAYAAAQPFGPVPMNNVVMLADKTGEERPIYVSSDWVLLDTTFIDDGRALAVQELSATDQSIRWIAVDRSGNTSELATTLGYSEIAAAPDGYLLFRASDNGASPTLTLEYHSGREAVQLWQQQSNGGITWSLLWTAPVPAAGDLGSFPAAS